MAITNQADLISKATALMGGSSALVSTTGQQGAADQATQELGWSLPQTDTTKCYWLIERCRRHIVYVLLVEQAHKFRFKQIHLQQRYANYLSMIEDMDNAFAKAIESNIGLFSASVDMSEFAEYIAMYVPSGFVYDQLGRDVTHFI